jgi:serine/threonine protein kinase
VKGAINIDLTGIILKGRYCIVEQVGRGGEGSMYLARDLELGIFRAVKELPASSRREAGLLRLLEHPYLPKMIDYTERGNFCYIIMEYIHGRSLEEYMQEGYVFSIEEILCIGDVTLQVLEYFHSRKPAVFYGDLKPANIMMTDQKRLYLVDFGSAVFSYSAPYKQREQEDMLPLNSCKER